MNSDKGHDNAYGTPAKAKEAPSDAAFPSHTAGNDPRSVEEDGVLFYAGRGTRYPSSSFSYFLCDTIFSDTNFSKRGKTPNPDASSEPSGRATCLLALSIIAFCWQLPRLSDICISLIL
ncbi:hypothetical protein ED733_007187 [Metarhizium rileyi]|nr:hypothetical protein ED733_007187 [Metarhizium rileyi]